MTDLRPHFPEPPRIGEALERDFERAGHAITDTAHTLAGAVSHIPHPHRYPQPSTPATTPEDTMSVLATIRNDVENAYSGFRTVIEDALPKLGGIADSIQGSTLAQYVFDIVGTIDPALEADMVTVLQVMARRAPAAAAPEVPAETVTAAVPAG
ncbi:MAG TPA: hypothetical protein VGS19_23860 [Streptosporangiaceae bacterium]|nr:hypothetical protein [Streptosporangiaceae bacterium]